MPRATVILCLAGVLLSMLSARGALGQSAATVADPQYLMFQVFTAGPGFSTEAGTRALTQLPDPGFLDAEAKQILDAVGGRGDELHRLGVTVGPLALDYTDTQLRTLIQRTFAIGAKYKIAVGLHIDDSKFWRNRRDLWSNRANIEWLNWKGVPNTGQYLNWGEPWKLAPQACFNSPAMLAEARRVSAQVIGPAIAQQVAKLRATGQEALFAGVIVGWETAIGRDYESRRDLGYCALTNLGFSEKSPPPDPDGALESVVQKWIETWSKGLADAGVASERIYSHIAFVSRKQFDDAHGSDGESYSRSVMYTPPSVAFGATHRPAFSTYPEAGMFGDIYAALDAHGAPHWGSAEGTNVNIQAGPPSIPEEGMQSYLARMFNHGASMTTLFGWGIGDPGNPFRKATEGAEAIAAYQKFLRGVRLDEKPLADSYQSGPSALQSRMHALPGKIAGYQRAGGDLAALQPLVQQLEQDMKDGQLDAMTRLLDQIESTIAAKVAANPGAAAASGFDISALQDRMHALPARIDAYQQHNGDMGRLKPRVESIQAHIGAGELEQAFDELKALDPILDSP